MIPDPPSLYLSASVQFTPNHQVEPGYASLSTVCACSLSSHVLLLPLRFHHDRGVTSSCQISLSMHPSNCPPFSVQKDGFTPTRGRRLSPPCATPTPTTTQSIVRYIAHTSNDVNRIAFSDYRQGKVPSDLGKREAGQGPHVQSIILNDRGKEQGSRTPCRC
jgi:hypothetical protein